MNDLDISRRKLLSTTGLALTASLAGCDSVPGNNPENTSSTTTTSDSSPSTFQYPEGFSATGIELETALGKDSAMATLDSLALKLTRKIQTPDQSNKSVQDGQFNAAEKQFTVSAEVSTTQTAKQSYYYSDGTLYIRQNPPNSEPSFQKDNYEFNVMQVYSLSQLQQHLKSVTLTVDRVEERDGKSVAVYTASASDFGSQSLFGSISEQGSFGTMETADVEIVVDTEGYVHLADFKIEFKNSSGATSTVQTTFDYSKFNSVSISKPEWVSSHDFTDLTKSPSATVEFSEAAGESVTVTVSDIKNADMIEVVVGNSLIQRLTEAGEVTVPAAKYTQDGETIPVTVYGRREGQQPTQIDQYVPEAPASGTSTTTTTTTASNSST